MLHPHRSTVRPELERADGTRDDGVVVYVGTAADGAWRIEAQLSGLTIQGAQITIHDATRVPAAVGGELWLWLVDARTRAAIGVSARVVHRRDDGGRRHLRLEFADRRAWERLLAAPLAPLLMRRAMFRAVPDPAEPVGVIVLAPRVAQLPLETATLVNVSAGGLCVEVGVAFEQGMAGLDTVECVLRLPGAAEPVTLVGRIRHRTLGADGRVRYGVELAEQDDLITVHARRVVAAYVARRQREMTEDWVADGGAGASVAVAGHVA